MSEPIIRTTGLSITGGARLNLADNDLIVDYTGVTSPIGTWNGRWPARVRSSWSRCIRGSWLTAGYG